MCVAEHATAVLIIGAPGAGKTTALGVLRSSLERDGIAFGVLESDQLAEGDPVLPVVDWAPQLAAVMALQRAAGRRLFLIAATPESDTQLDSIIAAVDAQPTLVVCLAAPPELAAERVAAREPDDWPGKPGLVAHARELAVSVHGLARIDSIIDTSDAPTREDLAIRLRSLMREHGVVP